MNARTSGSTTTAPITSSSTTIAPNVKASEIGVELDEAALLVLVVDDVERVEDRLHAGIRAPQREAEAHDERERQLAVIVARDAHDLIADELDRRPAGMTSARKFRCALSELAVVKRPYTDTSAVIAGTVASRA